MSHHMVSSATNPTGAVEVVRRSSAAQTAAPVDTGSIATSSQPISSVVPGAGAAPAAGASGTPGANLPVPDIEQASSTIQSARADLTRTTGAERRLDGFDLVGGGGGGGGGGGAQAEVADEGATDAVAINSAERDMSESGAGGARDAIGSDAVLNTDASTGTDNAFFERGVNEDLGNAQAISASAPQTEGRADDVIPT